MTKLAKKVFVIDDDEVYQFLINKQIGRLDGKVRVEGFLNGKSAIESLKEHAKHPLLLPDVIFLDIEMPVMDGWKFLEEFLVLNPQLSKKVRLYMVSSSISEIDIDRAYKYPLVSEYLVKPVPKEKIAQIVS